MKRAESINHVINTLKKEVKKFKEPIVTQYSHKKNPFKVLISCILSLRTKDEVTGKASKRLFSKADTPKKILKLKTKEIEKLIYPVGFYRTKAKRLKEISKTLLEEYNGKVPNNYNQLIRLRGVGPKTASITVVYGFNKPYFIPTDVHVHVIANRLGWVEAKNPEETMHELMKVVPKKYWYNLNSLFVAFGQNTCVTISPFCSKCPIKKYCPKIGVVRSR